MAAVLKRTPAFSKLMLKLETKHEVSGCYPFGNGVFPKGRTGLLVFRDHLIPREAYFDLFHGEEVRMLRAHTPTERATYVVLVNGKLSAQVT